MIVNVFLLVKLVLVTVVLGEKDPICRETAYGKYCSGIWPTRMTTADGALLLVGGNNSIYSFNTMPTLELKEKISVTPDPATIIRCNTSGTSQSQCFNIIKVIQPIPLQALNGNITLEEKYNDTILVCGTNAFSPKCNVHKRSNLSSSLLLSNSNDHEGFSPSSVSSTNVGLLATNGKFYTGTVFGKFSVQYRIAVSPFALQGDDKFLISTLAVHPLYISQDKTSFISIYEVDEYIYIFAKESAVEVGNTIVYSRVIRLCKSDEGIVESTVEQRNFLTFQKTRITCRDQSTKTSFPYNYDNITSTYLYQPPGNSTPELYITFSSPINAPEGSVVCKFAFSDESLNKEFNSGMYYVLESNTNQLSVKFEGSFSCPGTSGTQRTEKQAERDQLTDGNIQSSALVIADGETFTQIAVDVFDYFETRYEVMFVGTVDGQIKTYLYKESSSILISSRSISNDSINQLILTVMNDTQIRRLYVASDSCLVDIVVGNCSKYSSCLECMESNDLYCVWQDMKCINKLHVDTTNIQHTIEPITDIAQYCGDSSINHQTTTPPLSITSLTSILPSLTITTAHSTEQTKYITVTTTTFTTSYAECPLMIKTQMIYTASNDALPSPSIPVATIDPSTDFNTEPKIIPYGQIAGTLIGGLVVGFIIGIIICFIGLGIKRTLTNKTTSNESTPVHHNNSANSRSNGTINQYKINFNVKSIDEEPDHYEKVHPPSESPVHVNIGDEDDDDVITELPLNLSVGLATPKSHNRGRTESTRWLRASESENYGIESP
jgi:hypothetical protein